MKHAPLRHAVEYAGYRLVKAFLLRLSHTGARRFGRGLGRVGFRLMGAKRRLALRNLRLALPALGEAEHLRIVRDCFAHYGGHFCEVISASRFGREEILPLFDVEGLEHAQGLLATGKGFYLTTGHFGSFELAMYPLELLVGDLFMVARPPDNPRIEADVRKIRLRFGSRLIDKKGAAHQMLNACRRGGRVAIVIDQHIRPSAGIQVPFFGHPAWTSPVLAFLSLHTGRPVLPFTCEPLAQGRYRLAFHPPIEPDPNGPDGKGDAAQAALTRRYLEAVERDIRTRPELWLWMHRRWREG